VLARKFVMSIEEIKKNLQVCDGCWSAVGGGDFLVVWRGVFAA
jgi:hypothetical protein